MEDKEKGVLTGAIAWALWPDLWRAIYMNIGYWLLLCIPLRLLFNQRRVGSDQWWRSAVVVVAATGGFVASKMPDPSLPV